MTTWLVWAGLLASAQTGVRVPELWVELVDTTSLGDEALLDLRREVERLFRPAGIVLVWRRQNPIELEAHMATVYLLDEIPRRLGQSLRSFGGGRPMGVALGHVEKTSGPVAYVSRGSVAETIAGGDGELARALGRVVAHELGHRFLQRAHRRRGLMKEHLGRDDLLGSGDHLILDDDEAFSVAAVALAPAEKR